MKTLKYLILAMTGLTLSACNMDGLEAKQSQRLGELTDKFHLTATEIDLAHRAISGYKNELGTQVLRDRDLHQAICYATSVEMPEQYTKAHLLYLENYAQADKDYYAWFADQGISEEVAEKMGNIYVDAHDRCKTMQGRLQNMKSLKARRNL